MNSIKKYILFSVVTILILFGIYFALKDSKVPVSPIKNKQNVIYRGLPSPTKNLNITITEDVVIKDYAESLPIYTFTKKSLTENDITDYARNIGFSTNPTIVGDYFDGDTYIWNENNTDLVIYPNSSRLSYTKNLDNLNNINNISTDLMVNSAESFLDLFDISPIYHSSTINLRPENHIIQVNFKTFNAQHEWVTENPASSPINVSVSSDLEVVNSNIILIDQTVESNETYSIKKLTDINRSIKDLILVSLDNGEVPLDQSSNLSNNRILIDEIELAYFTNISVDTQVLPIFILSGTMQLEESDKYIEAILYLPAIK